MGSKKKTGLVWRGKYSKGSTETKVIEDSCKESLEDIPRSEINHT